MMRGTLHKIGLAWLFVLALAACSGGGGGGGSAAAPIDSLDEPAGLAAVADVVEEVRNSVVSIRTVSGEGSGVVFGEDGLVITNEPVVGDAHDVVVALADGSVVPGEVMASDPVVDVAVISVEGVSLPAVEVDLDLPRVGSLAIALGNPLGFENTVTAGVVSGLHRQIPGSAQQTPALVDLIQTDAAISPGNSGGALLSAEGELIGINVAYIPPQARAVSIGFAIPAATVVETVEELIEHGRAEHPWLGIVPAPVNPRLAEQFDLPVSAGVLVAQVEDGGPSDRALRRGDIVVEIEGRSTTSVEDLLATLRNFAPGDVIELVVVRDDQRRDVQVQLGTRP